MNIKKNKNPHEIILKRIELFKQKVKSTGVDTEKTKGLSAAAVSSYRQRQNLPKGDTLEEWGATFDLNLNWLFWGEGQMLRRQEQVPEKGHQLDEVVELLRENRQLRQALDIFKEQGETINFNKSHALGANGAVHSLHQDSE